MPKPKQKKPTGGRRQIRSPRTNKQEEVTANSLRALAIAAYDCSKFADDQPASLAWQSFATALRLEAARVRSKHGGNPRTRLPREEVRRRLRQAEAEAKAIQQRIKHHERAMKS